MGSLFWRRGAWRQTHRRQSTTTAREPLIAARIGGSSKKNGNLYARVRSEKWESVCPSTMPTAGRAREPSVALLQRAAHSGVRENNGEMANTCSHCTFFSGLSPASAGAPPAGGAMCSCADWRAFRPPATKASSESARISSPGPLAPRSRRGPHTALGPKSLLLTLANCGQAAVCTLPLPRPARSPKSVAVCRPWAPRMHFNCRGKEFFRFVFFSRKHQAFS
jgi:hypothetical protein